MSLEVDGVWKSGVWATTVWADGVWREAITGTGVLTTPAVTSVGTGKLKHTGTGVLTVPITTLAGAGQLTHKGTGDITTGAVTLAGAGTQSGAQTGTGTLTTPAATITGTGVIKHTGTGDLTIGPVELDGQSTRPDVVPSGGIPYRPFHEAHPWLRSLPQEEVAAIEAIPKKVGKRVVEAIEHKVMELAPKSVPAQEAAVMAYVDIGVMLESNARKAEEQTILDNLLMRVITNRIVHVRNEEMLLLLMAA